MSECPRVFAIHSLCIYVLCMGDDGSAGDGKLNLSYNSNEN